MYDKAFDYGTKMLRNKYEFTYENSEYVLWIWKGDYWNMENGAEAGLYVYNRTENGIKHYNAVDYELPMTLSLYKIKEDGYDNLFNWAPDEPQWWITGFSRKDMFFINPDKLRMICSVDMSEHRGLFNELKTSYENKDKNIIFDNNMVWVTF